jgi:hypothetical protein
VHRKVWLETLKGRDHLEDVDMYGSIILEWMLRRVGGYGLDAFGLG